MSNVVLQKSRFIHIPKCAGTFLQAVLNHLNIGIKHTYTHPHSGHLCLHQMSEEDYYNFTFVRHPYTWWTSYYYYMQRGVKESGKDVIPFDVWFENENPFWLGHYTTVVKRFVGMDDLYPTSNKIHFTGKSENLKEDLHKALTLAGEVFSHERFETIFENKNGRTYKWTNIQDYDRVISDRSKELIYRGEKWIFDTYKYPA